MTYTNQILITMAKIKATLSKKVAHPKMDPYRVSNQEWELDWIVNKMKHEGYKTSRDQIRAIKKLFGSGRKKVYNEIRTPSV